MPPEVPIVGRPGTLVGWWPTTLYWCKCVPDELGIVVLTGFKNPSACQKCGKVYMVDGLQAASGGWTPVIGVYMAAPADQRPQ